MTVAVNVCAEHDAKSDMIYKHSPLLPCACALRGRAKQSLGLAEL